MFPSHDRGGNGRVYKNRKIIYVLSSEEVEIVDRIKTIAHRYGHTPDIQMSEETNSVRVSLTWKALAGAISQHIGHGAHHKFLSRELLVMPRNWQSQFLQAYIGGDGHTRNSGKEKGKITITTASYNLAMSTRLLCARLGITASCSGRYNRKATWFNGSPIYNLDISSGQSKGYERSSGGGPEAYIHPDGFILSPVREITTSSWIVTGKPLNQVALRL